MNNKVFISAPMSSFKNDADYVYFREDILAFIAFLESEYDIHDIFYAGMAIKTKKNFETSLESYIKDMEELSNSTCFILFYPQKSPSGSLIELGYSIAKKIPIIIFTPDRKLLPYMMAEFDSYEEKAFIYEYPQKCKISDYIRFNEQIKTKLHNIIYKQ